MFLWGGGSGGTQRYAAGLWNGTDSSFQFDLSAWEYLKGELVKTHQLSILYHSSSEEQGVFYVEYELENGMLSEIQRIAVPQYDIQDVDSCISKYAKWEGWNWCRIQHFLQKG